MTTSPPEIAALCRELADLGERTRRDGPWASGALERLARRGVLAAFIPADCGGTGLAEREILPMLVEIARSCLTTALAVTQWASGCRLIASAAPEVRSRYLPAIARGEASTTVGISQLTTSRRHLAAPAVSASRDADGWRLTGLCPWVTGGDTCDTIVTGAAAGAGEPTTARFFIVPRDAAGVVVEPPMELLALSGSRTSAVRFERALAAEAIELEGDRGVRSGGLATSALAIGAAASSVGLLDELASEGSGRPDVLPVADGLRAECDAAADRLARAADDDGGDATLRDALRAEATSLAIRAAQAALVASKGAGYVVGHPAERAVRESMFFLVWSCPQAVASAVMCRLAGLAS